MSVSITDTEVAGLRQRWRTLGDTLCLQCSIGENEQKRRWDEWWLFIYNNYRSEKRAYHTLRHVTELYWHFERAKENGWLQRPELVELAIWFHDVIYTGVNKQDEDDSADEFERFGMDIGLREQDVQSVSRWIRLTATHTCNLEDNGIDCCMFMDFDMSILGKPWNSPWEGYTMEGDSDQHNGYATYALSLVVEEYRSLKDVPKVLTEFFIRGIWCFGRARFLKTTVGKDVFATEQYRAMYGDDAKRNIQQEMKHWQRIQVQTKLFGAAVALTLVFVIYRAVLLMTGGSENVPSLHGLQSS